MNSANFHCVKFHIAANLQLLSHQTLISCCMVICLCRSKGVYNKVRNVLDLKGFYYLAAEYMDCNQCKATYIAYDER